MATPNIRFFFDGVQIELRDRTRLKQFISKLVKREGKKLESLNYIFCTDKALLKINKDYLRHNYFTDIITFDLSETKGVITGEIYISLDRVRANARAYQTSLKEELHRVIFHGALHLAGYQDKTKAEVASMRRKERDYLDQYFK